MNEEEERGLVSFHATNNQTRRGKRNFFEGENSLERMPIYDDTSNLRKLYFRSFDHGLHRRSVSHIPRVTHISRGNKSLAITIETSSRSVVLEERGGDGSRTDVRNGINRSVGANRTRWLERERRDGI